MSETENAAKYSTNRGFTPRSVHVRQVVKLQRSRCGAVGSNQKTREGPCSESHATCAAKTCSELNLLITTYFRVHPHAYPNIAHSYNSSSSTPLGGPLLLITNNRQDYNTHVGVTYYASSTNSGSGRTFFLQAATNPPLMTSRRRERVGVGQTTNFAKPVSARAVDEPFSTRSHTSLPRARAQTAALSQPNRLQGSLGSRRSKTASSRCGSSRPRGKVIILICLCVVFGTMVITRM